MANSKPRLVKDYDKLPEDILEQIKLQYPKGFHRHLIKYTDRTGQQRSALPFEAEDVYYLVRMTLVEAKAIIEEDDDYDDDGFLREDVREEYEEKYSDEEETEELDIDTMDRPDVVDDEED